MVAAMRKGSTPQLNQPLCMSRQITTKQNCLGWNFPASNSPQNDINYQIHKDGVEEHQVHLMRD